MDIEFIHPGEEGDFSMDEICDFLYEHLEEFGDPREHIMKCLNYAMSQEKNKGGFITVASEDDKIVGAVAINTTAMEDYIPPNILVYIAVHRDNRGEGLGKKLLRKTFDEAEGDIALHVEPDNPACYAYESVGMVNDYLEYRYHKD